jgi:hypothetical protein
MKVSFITTAGAVYVKLKAGIVVSDNPFLIAWNSDD